ncbi:MAG: hypothetical protein ABGX25_00855 [Nautiliaceae bacterium]
MKLKEDVLKNISDGLCDSEYELIDFDEVSSNYATVDGLIIKDDNCMFIEFKDLQYVSLMDWLSNNCICEETGVSYIKKIKCNKENILLKGYESFLLYKDDLKDKNIWFIFVYSHKETVSKDKKFKEHFTRNILNRLKIIYNEVRIMRCDKFLKFIEKI